jgi:hypothetical protein
MRRNPYRAYKGGSRAHALRMKELKGIRRTWAIDPATRVVPDKRKKIRLDIMSVEEEEALLERCEKEKRSDTSSDKTG